MSAIEPLPSSTPSSSAWTPALRTSQRVPTISVSYRTTRPRRNGSFEPARAVEAGVEALRGVEDPAVGVAEGDGDRVAAAHQDAFDQRLAAVGVARHGGKSTGCRRSRPVSRAAATLSAAASIRRRAAST